MQACEIEASFELVFGRTREVEQAGGSQAEVAVLPHEIEGLFGEETFEDSLEAFVKSRPDGFFYMGRAYLLRF